MTDLFKWSDDDIPYLLNDWVQIIDLLGFDVKEITALYDLYFDMTPIGEGNVHVFISDDQPENTMAFDLYRALCLQIRYVSFLYRHLYPCLKRRRIAKARRSARMRCLRFGIMQPRQQ